MTVLSELTLMRRRRRRGGGSVSDVKSKSRSFPEVDRTDFQSIQLSHLISRVNAVHFRSGKKCCVSPGSVSQISDPSLQSFSFFLLGFA